MQLQCLTQESSLYRHYTVATLRLQACNRQSIYCVPLFDSLGENAVEYIINHSESSILFVFKEKLDTVIQALLKALKGLKTLVYWGTHNENHAGADAVRFLQQIKTFRFC